MSVLLQFEMLDPVVETRVVEAAAAERVARRGARGAVEDASAGTCQEARASTVALEPAARLVYRIL